MSVEWAAPAAKSLEQYLDHLTEHASAIEPLARREILAAAERLGSHPFLGRPSRWAGLRELSLLRWKKIVVYRLDAGRVSIVAFYDTRQDLGAVEPQS